MQTYRALHADALLYLRQFTHTADIPSRQRLRSSTTDSLSVPVLSTVGRLAFPQSLVHMKRFTSEHSLLTVSADI